MKIIFITLSNIGDVILTLPAFSLLRTNFKDAKIDVVVGPRAKDVFIKDPRVNKLFVYDKNIAFRKKIDFIKELRSERYDLAVDMRTSLMPILIGAKRYTNFMAFGRIKRCHKRLVHLNRLKGLGISITDIPKKNIYIDDNERKLINELLEENSVEKNDILIGMSPACRSLLKQWHTDGFIEVIKAILKQGDYKIVLIGDSNQVEISQKIVSAIQDPRLLDLTGKTDLNMLFALIERTKLLVTCDSAPLHIACDLGVRVVAIFGPTDPVSYGPTGNCDIVVRKDLRCSPCNKARCSFNNECMRLIEPDNVLEAIKGILTKL